MNLRPLVLFTALSASLAGCIINVNGAGMTSFDYHRQQQLILDATQLQQLVAETGAGVLIIEGGDGLSEVRIEADIYGYDGAEPELSLVQEGEHAKLIANFDSFRRVSFTSGSSPYIDLVVKVPANMKLTLDDGSGNIEIRGVNAEMSITDGSGSITIDGAKALTIDDGSGGIALQNIEGNISLTDGSGSIEIQQVNGDVSVHDGSGSIVINHVAGLVTIDDGSGSIRVDNSKGLHIIESGSGDLSFDNIQGPVTMD